MIGPPSRLRRAPLKAAIVKSRSPTLLSGTAEFSLGGGGQGFFFAVTGQRKSDGDDPDEAGESCEGNEEKELRADEMEDAKFAAGCQAEAEDHDPSGDEI